ncbi:uncharacterized protein LOC131884909 [Tigriopus californicus]|uniref:uncharacterized protein LOC131884909 n=1 Tax=Tigriopus californicus TaxID=6832 RepID=UPI0027DA0135|nr:uncharacterized protein LOC131884909 [Tigriopus californicus]
MIGLFSIFSIVSFKNDPCTTTGASSLGGTCLTSTACSSKGGFASGNCASGFGVCCLFRVSGSCGTTQTVNQNCTYIQNDGFPSADTTVDETCTYEFNRICESQAILIKFALTLNTHWSFLYFRPMSDQVSWEKNTTKHSMRNMCNHIWEIDR